MCSQTPHLDKLVALLANEKLPESDRLRVEAAIVRYKEWITAIENVTGDSPTEIINQMVALLNEYKLYIEVELIFDSKQDFLYRQKGQLKLDNTINEEFLPRLIIPKIIPEIRGKAVNIGPISSYSAVYFASSLDAIQVGGGLNIRVKDQDFAISKKLYLKASHSPDFKEEDCILKETNLAYIAAECKTNLDKTMFQEACATAHDLKSAVSGAKYYLLAEWLDMTPLSTAPTDIDEVLILRKAKRINSNVRSAYSSFTGRQENRESYINYLRTHPFRPEVYERFVSHIRKLFTNEVLVEDDVLKLGYF